MTLDSFGARSRSSVGDRTYDIFRLDAVVDDPHTLPYSLRVLLENLLRREDGVERRPPTTSAPSPTAAVPRQEAGHRELQFMPARVLMQDFTGVPAIVDLAAMRDAMADLGGDTAHRRAGHPRRPRDRPLDHRRRRRRRPTRSRATPSSSSRATASATRSCGGRSRRSRRCACSRPNRGICHQVNLEYLAQVVFRDADGLAYPDTLVGTDSHTPMVNGLGVLGWGVGGIEAEAAMLGQPISMLLPRVVGIELVGALPAGRRPRPISCSPSRELLREHGVVGKFVEFYGEGVGRVPLENRATIGNMSPEYGSTCTLFPIDDETLRYLRATGRPDDLVALVETYAKEQGLWHDPAVRSRSTTRRSSSTSRRSSRRSPGPARPQDRVSLSSAKAGFADALAGRAHATRARRCSSSRRRSTLADGRAFELADGAVVIAAITSCTNTSNPSVMIAAGLLARNAVARGLTVPPWVKTSLAPGSLVVTDYYDEGRAARAARRARLRRRRLRLHHVHRQLRPARARDLARRSTDARPLGVRRCCRATATSRAASIPTAA